MFSNKSLMLKMIKRVSQMVFHRIHYTVMSFKTTYSAKDSLLSQHHNLQARYTYYSSGILPFPSLSNMAKAFLKESSGSVPVDGQKESSFSNELGMHGFIQ